jgi:prophage antirepressor-like protein
MNEIQIFSYDGNKLRTVEKDGEMWWVLKDVCVALELSNPTVVAGRLDKDEVTKFNLGGLSGENNVINESGLYNVILRSDKPQAKHFKRWVTHEVLPQIRKTGEYKKPLTLLETAKELVAALEREEKLKAALEQKALQLDEGKKYYTIKRVAKLNGVNGKTINWRGLKNTSDYLNYEVKKVFDPNFGSVNAYHIDVWRTEYGNFSFEEMRGIC